MNANDTEHRGTRPSVLAALVVVCAIAAFAAPLGGPWLFDDLALIPGNRFVHELSAWPHWFSSSLWDTNYHPGHAALSAFWRPAVLASYALDWRVSGGRPFAFHVTNLVLHAAASLLAFDALRRWSRSAQGAFVGALLFAIHPTKAECVAWIAGRADVLCAIGVFVAMRGVAMRLAKRRAGIALEVAGLALAYLSKEQAVVLPLFVAAEAWAAQRRWDLRKTTYAVAPHALIAVAYLLARRVWLPIGQAHDPIAFTTHAAYVLESFARYVVLSAWPGDLSLGRAQLVFVDGRATPTTVFVALGALAVVAVALCAWACRARAPGVSIGAALFALSLAPVCNVVWIGYLVLVSPRYLYLPSFGLALVAAELFAAATARRARALTIAACALATAFGARSIVRAKDFDSEQAFWSYETAHNATYSPAMLYTIARELNERRPRAALRDAIAGREMLRAHAPADVNRAEITVLALQAALVLVPDLARDELTAVRAFIADVGAQRDARLALPRLDVDVRVRANDAEGAWMRERSSMSLESIAGDAASRVGDDVAALRSARRIASECARCWTLLVTTTLVAARAGDFDLATALLANLRADAPANDVGDLGAALDDARRLAAARRDAPAGLRSVIDTRYFARLGAWGRAYESAKRAIETPDALDAASAASLGELSFRAGDAKGAAVLFARVMPAADVDARMHALALDMRWIDAPLQGGE